MLQIMGMAMSNSVMLRTISDLEEWIKINLYIFVFDV